MESHFLPSGGPGSPHGFLMMAHTELKFNEAICVQGTSLMPALSWAPRSGVEGSSSGGGGEPHPSGKGRELGACDLVPLSSCLGSSSKHA